MQVTAKKQRNEQAVRNEKVLNNQDEIKQTMGFSIRAEIS